MAQRTCPSPLDPKTFDPKAFDPTAFDPKAFAPKADLATDYALIASGVGAALVALIYLILI